ncbi:MAG: lytic transglycosylase domain-containing protein [Candidatus Eremiobacteraeota bacterium]|nr:lytic transglycosylase domain-containing protein [Candidatus Eremiobacteraeota bacterium]
MPKADPIIVSTIEAFNEDIGRKEAVGLASLIEETANRYDVDPLLVTALISQESAFYEDAVSPVGAVGLGQLMPYTAEDLGVNPNVPAENLDGCVRYLAQNLDTWAHTDDPVALALASYNAGPGAVSNYGGIPPYEETQNYVAVITSRYQWLLNENLAATAEVYG